MRVRAVKKYSNPNFPAKSIKGDYPGLLFRSLPKRWRKHKATLTALMACMVMGNGCRKADRPPSSKRVMAGEEKKSVKSFHAKIAPLFIHGQGQGATGCVVISPPVFLSEEEAMDMIIQELEKNHLNFFPYCMPVGGLTFTEVREEFTLIEKPQVKYKVQKINGDTRQFYFDLFDKETGTGIKFVNENNYFQMGGLKSGSSAQMYDFISLGQQLRENLQAKSGYNAAIFYDPLMDMHDYSSLRSLHKRDEISRQELIRQIDDFVCWYQTEIKPDQGKS